MRKDLKGEVLPGGICYRFASRLSRSNVDGGFLPIYICYSFKAVFLEEKCQEEKLPKSHLKI